MSPIDSDLRGLKPLTRPRGHSLPSDPGYAGGFAEGSAGGKGDLVVQGLNARRLVWRRLGAFTLVELLVVIAIVGALAALIVGLTRPAGIGKVKSRLSVEREVMVGAIEAYHKHYGFYPPDNPDPKKTGLSPLYYELTGVTNVPANHLAVMGVAGIANVDGKNFYAQMKPSAFGPDPNNQNVLVMVVPYGAPAKGVNPWRYRSGKPEHNTESFDLWAEVMFDAKTVQLGNWRD